MSDKQAAFSQIKEHEKALLLDFEAAKNAGASPQIVETAIGEVKMAVTRVLAAIDCQK